jgi:mRNA-degrading endonuclease RelE of RelBE toxin-antitoxin system
VTPLRIEPSFLRAAKSLPPDRQRAVNAALVKFQKTPELPSLKFRPLKGLSGFFIINSVHGDRVILRKDDSNTFAAVDAGPHDNVYRRWTR